MVWIGARHMASHEGDEELPGRLADFRISRANENPLERAVLHCRTLHFCKMARVSDLPEHPETVKPVPELPAFRWFLRGVRHAVSMPGLVLFASYVGYGALLQGVDFPILAGVLSTYLIWALPAQVILVGGLAAGTALPALALAVMLSSIRFLPMVVAIAPYMRGPRRSLLQELFCAHYVAMTVWVEGLRLLPHMPGEGRVPFTLGLGNMLIFQSMIATAVGFYMAGEVPPPVAAGLLFLTPLFFSIVLVRGATAALDWMSLAAGVLLIPVVQYFSLGDGLDLMVAGIGGGTATYAIDRIFLRGRRKGRRA